jgi:hypothetical protein
MLETLLVLVFILFKEIGRSRSFIPDMLYLFFCDISLFPFLGVLECVVGQNPPACSAGNTRSWEASGTAGGPRSLSQRPRIRHTTSRLGLLGMPPDLYLVSFPLNQTLVHRGRDVAVGVNSIPPK